MEVLNVSELKSPIIKISLFSEASMVNIFSICFMKIVLSVLVGLYTIITETFLTEFMSDIFISSMILLKLNLIEYLFHRYTLYC